MAFVIWEDGGSHLEVKRPLGADHLRAPAQPVCLHVEGTWDVPALESDIHGTTRLTYDFGVVFPLPVDVYNSGLVVAHN